MKRTQAGFSIIELLIVVAIISILSSVIFLNFREGAAQSRDAERRADLRTLQNALELYRQENGRYPEACNGPSGWSQVGDGWSGEMGSTHACSSGNQYIVDLAPEFISTLPTDPRPQSGDHGYAYAVNSEGTVYKLMSRNAVETETVDYDHAFKSCDATDSAAGMCDAVNSNSNSKPTHCTEGDARFQTSYAVWGGYADVAPNVSNADVSIERQTEDVICRW